MLLCVVALTTTVNGAITALYSAPGKYGSHMSPTVALLKDGEGGKVFDGPTIVEPPLTKIFVFGIQDENTGVPDFLVITTLGGATLEVGDFVGHSSPNPGRPYPHIGLDWAAGGRFLESSTSLVDVLEVKRDSENNLIAVAFDFHMFENVDSLEGDPGPSVFGSFRYNSDIPLTTLPEAVPETAPSLLLGLAGILLFQSRRRR